MRTPDIQRARCVCVSCYYLAAVIITHQPASWRFTLSHLHSLSMYLFFHPQSFASALSPSSSHLITPCTLSSPFGFHLFSLSLQLFNFTCSVSLAVFLFGVCHFSSASPALVFVLSPVSDSIHHVRCGLLVKVTGTERKDEENKRVWRWPHRGLKSLRPYLPSPRCSWTLLFIFLRAIFLSFFHT